MSTRTQYDISTLLEMAGARPRGNRHDCPKCGGLRTVTHTAECFYCHKCGSKGNSVTLAKELGVYQRIPKADYIRQQKAREQAERAARQFVAACGEARRRAAEALRELGRLELMAHECRPEHPQTWDALALVYQQQPRLAVEYALLCHGAIAERRRWLEADAEGRARMAEQILLTGEIQTADGKFAEVTV